MMFLGSCNKQDETDEQLILDYLADNNLNAERTDDGLYYIIENPGSSEKPNVNSTVNVDYLGYLLDGTEFDSGNDVEFALWSVIDGWTLGIPLFGKGGSGTLLIPSSLGYGNNQAGGIPPNSVLVFDITLNDFQ